MILGVLTILIMLGVAFAFWREGALRAATAFVNVLAAGLVAFNFFEPLANGLEPLLARSFLHGYEDSFCLMALFALTLGLLRLAANSLARKPPEQAPVVQRGGAVLFGLLTGYLASGFLVCVLQTMPFPQKFLGFETEVNLHAPGNKVRRWLPPDRVWLALMQFGSQMGLARGEDDVFDKDGTFELRYLRHRRAPDHHDPSPYQGEPYQAPAPEPP
jgi:hypothetical protein